MTTLLSTPGSTASLGERRPCQPPGLSESEEPRGVGWGGGVPVFGAQSSLVDGQKGRQMTAIGGPALFGEGARPRAGQPSRGSERLGQSKPFLFPG